MKLSAVLSTYAVVAAISCILYLFFPALSLALYSDATATPQTDMLFRVIGAMMGGLGVMAWLARNAVPSDSRNAMVLGLIAGNVLAVAAMTPAVLTGAANAFGWGPIVVCVLFALGFYLAGPGATSHVVKSA